MWIIQRNHSAFHVNKCLWWHTIKIHLQFNQRVNIALLFYLFVLRFRERIWHCFYTCIWWHFHKHYIFALALAKNDANLTNYRNIFIHHIVPFRKHFNLLSGQKHSEQSEREIVRWRRRDNKAKAHRIYPNFLLLFISTEHSIKQSAYKVDA